MLNCCSLSFFCSRARAQGAMRAAEDQAGESALGARGWRFPQQREMGEEGGWRKKPLWKSFFPVNRFSLLFFSAACTQTCTHIHTLLPLCKKGLICLSVCGFAEVLYYVWRWNTKQELAWSKASNPRPPRVSFKQGKREMLQSFLNQRVIISNPYKHIHNTIKLDLITGPDSGL